MAFFATINSVYVLIGSLLLGASCGVLGVFAVLRKQGLLGDTLAHASLPGIAIAFLIMKTKFLPGLLFGALISALIAAGFLHLLVSRTKIKMDSGMASILSVFFGGGVLILTYIQNLPISAQAGLDSFLFGQAAALLLDDIVWMAGTFIVIFCLVALFWKELKIFTFDSEFALVLGFKKFLLEILFMTIFVLSILMSLQAVGVVLTAALFITPAVSALLWTNSLLPAVVLSSFFGMISGASGALISANVARMPTGPVIVLAATAIFIVSFLFAPKKGIFRMWLHHLRHSAKVQMENVLGRFYRDSEQGVANWKIADYMGFGYRKSVLALLKRRDFVNIADGEISLTKNGMQEARWIIEKHRLWETYLIHQWKIAPDHVHRDADTIEHILTPEVVEKLRKILHDTSLT